MYNRENITEMIARQMRKRDQALTAETWDNRTFALMGMQQALREMLPHREYLEIMHEAEQRANC